MFSEFIEIKDDVYSMFQGLATIGGSNPNKVNKTFASKNPLIFGTIIHNVLLCNQPTTGYIYKPLYTEPCEMLYNMGIFTKFEFDTMKTLEYLRDNDGIFKEIRDSATMIERGFICHNLSTDVVLRCKFDMLIKRDDEVIVLDLKTTSKAINIKNYEYQMRYYLWCARHMFPECTNFKGKFIAANKNGLESSLEYINDPNEPFTNEEIEKICLEFKENTDESKLLRAFSVFTEIKSQII